jgi:ribosomal protein RSM22 (predicted rRNA methylase)
MNNFTTTAAIVDALMSDEIHSLAVTLKRSEKSQTLKNLKKVMDIHTLDGLKAYKAKLAEVVKTGKPRLPMTGTLRPHWLKFRTDSVISFFLQTLFLWTSISNGLKH